MKQVFISKTGISIQNVPEPVIEDNKIIVRNLYSCISTGTEIAGYRSIKKNIFKKIYENPTVIKSVFDIFKNQGISKTKKIIEKKLGKFYEVGYSSSGIIEQVGKSVKSFVVGDYVACAGGGVASHAEKIIVPENLAVKVENSKNLKFYSSVALGAIALHSIRRLSPSLGDTCLVVGLGLIGQITLRLLKANGINVFGIDPNTDCVNKAKESGFKNIFRSFKDLRKKTLNLDIDGFDGVIVNAASKSDSILNDSINQCRRKARLIVVGDVNLSFNREEAYKKEIDLLMSTSYGPGRYDQNYEILGQDYPAEYVRWTLNRNMKAYTDLINSQEIDLNNLFGNEVKIDDVLKVYKSLEKKISPISAVIRYDSGKIEKPKYKPRVLIKKKIPICAIIGAGSFSNDILIPNLLKNKNLCQLACLCVKKPVSVLNLSSQFKNIEVKNDYNEVLRDRNIDTIFITTRHNLHYEIINKCLKFKKRIFVEKPICTKKEELKSLKKTLNQGKNRPVIVTGFNRRFSDSAKIMFDFIRKYDDEVFIDYHVNADSLAKNSWVYSKEGGGRNIGEACHFYDLLNFLTRSKVKNIFASSISCKSKKKYEKTDNFSVLIKFKNGSVGRVNFLSKGNKNKYKEIIEIRGGEETLVVENFQSIKILRNNNPKIIYSVKNPEKGHERQIKEFFRFLMQNDVSIPIEEQIDAMELCFLVEELL